MSEIDNDLSNRKKIVLIAIMLSGTMIAMLNQTLLAPALPSIMTDLAITASQAQWLTTAFMLVSGIMIPITAYFINRFTTRTLFITSMSLFTLGTFCASISMTFGFLLFGRILQAMGAGILMPLQQTVLLLLVPKEKRGMAMGIVGFVMVVAPSLGPTLAGWMVDQYDWHSLFYMILPLAILDIVLAACLLKNVGKPSHPTLDVLSVIFSTFGFGGLLYGFSVAGDAGWTSATTLISLSVGTTALTLFIQRQLKLEEPLLQLRVFSNKTFAYSTILGMILNAAMIAGAIIMPLYVQNILGYSAIYSGLMMLPGTILMGILSPITGKLFDQYGPRQLTLVGLFIITLTSVCLSQLAADTELLYLTGIYTLRSSGFALLMMPLTTWGLNALDNSVIPHGTACNNTLRQVAGSIGTALLITVMTVCTNNTLDQGPVQSTINGMNAAFACVAVLNLITLILAFAVMKTPQPAKENQQSISN